ncbi:DUF5683 domain-containing protein [Hymenobacter coccineus]|uniref:DUF5683 domain-containing protein n=1 Tax=Hymenobacter coccineus TaxID=1908235 RepID=A0A1G1TJL4_9BACT|nr:DUF5683 domain-containing protein [Hymenobacter coccineus]OGX91065.1 hypothetical protein BEN49_21150 [Hymenobacter coccineus]
MNKSLLHLAALLLLVLGAAWGPRAARAQVLDPTNPNVVNPAAPPVVRPDTARIRKPTLADKRKKNTEDSLRRTEKFLGMRVTPPAKAGYMALVPGLGQIYNRRWWKLPLVYGALGTVAGILIFEQQALTEYSNASERLRTDSAIRTQTFPIAALGPRAGKENSPEAIQNGIVFYRHYRDGFIFYTGIVYGLQALDAIVDAHLKTFDVGDDLTLHWQPTMLWAPGGPGIPVVPGVAVALHFK